MTPELHAAARALQAVVPIGYGHQISHADAATFARAVLTAVREPGERVLTAVGVEFATFDGNSDSFEDYAPDVVRGFIDAILAD